MLLPMITIARFQVPEDAHLFRAYLESRGISATVFDEHVVQLFWHYSNAIGGVRVVVPEEEVPEATAAHREYLEALNSAPREFSGARAWPLVLLLSLALGAPFLAFGRRMLVKSGKDV
jgi:hypothetical protein